MNETRKLLLSELHFHFISLFGTLWRLSISRRPIAGFRQTGQQWHQRTREAVRVFTRDEPEPAELTREELFVESGEQHEPDHEPHLQERHRQGHHRGGREERRISEEEEQEEVPDHHQQPPGCHGSHKRSPSKTGELLDRP